MYQQSGACKPACAQLAVFVLGVNFGMAVFEVLLLSYLFLIVLPEKLSSEIEYD